MKVMLILVDGMRPDAMVQFPQAQALMQSSATALDAQTVFPSVTLPCHVSLFHSVDPARHGTTTNTYMPQVRPIDGLCESLGAAGKRCAFFFNWEQLRDLSRPGSLCRSFFVNMGAAGYPEANRLVTENALASLKNDEFDFAFVYLGWVDEAGHDHGWMSDEYMRAMNASWNDIDRLVAAAPEDCGVIVTADHGGHDRTHGTTMPEDMTIPVILHGKPFAAGTTLTDVSIKDIAPTVAALLGSCPSREWEGKSLC